MAINHRNELMLISITSIVVLMSLFTMVNYDQSEQREISSSDYSGQATTSAIGQSGASTSYQITGTAYYVDAILGNDANIGTYRSR